MRLRTLALIALVSSSAASCSNGAGSPGDGTAVLPASLAAGAPPVELDSYTTTAGLDLDLGDIGLAIRVSGSRDHDRFECTIRYETGGEVRMERVTGDAHRIWLGDGELDRARYADPAVVSVLSLCPATTDFWLDYRIGELDEVTAEGLETVNGVTAAEYRLAEAIGSIAGSRVVPELHAAEFDRLDLWRELESGAVVRLVIAVTGDAETMAAALGIDAGAPGEKGHLTIEIDVLNLDQAPRVTLP